MIAFEIYMYVVIASAILSWLIAFKVVNTSNRLVFTIWDFLTRVTEPALRRIRRFMPNLGGVDLSPLILILALILIQRVLLNILISLSSGGY